MNLNHLFDLSFIGRRDRTARALHRAGHTRRLNPARIGASRKAFLGPTVEADADYATAAAITVAILNGAHVVRVHNVRHLKIAVQIADQVLAGMPEPEPMEPPKAPAPRRRAESLGSPGRPIRPAVR